MLEKQKYVSLAAVVVAAVLFGMVLSGGLGVTPRVAADNPKPVEQQPPLTGTTVPDFAALAERVVPSVVSVFSTEVSDPSEGGGSRSPHPFGFFFGPQNEEQEQEPTLRRSSGSGFFISSDGELLTNYHVIADADKIEIELEDDTRYEVKVVGRDPETDIALLRVIDADREFPVLPLGDAESLRVGEWVMAVGNPLNMDHTVTVGVVSAKGRVLGLSNSSFENFIQTDAAINFGNSGGPLVNLRGETIGINTAINARGQNLGFAVPVNTAKRILTSLREDGKVVRGYLGVMVRTIDQDIEESFGLDSRDGAFVEDVVKDHAADKGGLKPGDVIVKVNGMTVKTTRELIDTVSSLRPKTKVSLDVIRNGSSKSIDVVLEEREASDDVPEVGEQEDDEDPLLERVGIAVSELSSRNRQHYGVDPDLDGVVISRVRAVSPAGEKGLLRGDIITQINGVAISSEDDLRAEIAAIANDGLVRIYIFRPRANRSFFAILRLDELE